MALVERIRVELEAERSTEGFASKKASDAKRREKVQTAYVEDVRVELVRFLAFHQKFAELADRMAKAIADHAAPVGSGTVARRKRIPVERRAEAAAIA